VKHYGLLTQETFADEAEPGIEYVWIEWKVRVLVNRADYEDALHEDILISGSIGKPVDCDTCNKVAIDLTDFPHGLDKYGMHGSNVYCPHCDGGEDVG
jgi:hypothetical protein